MATKALPNLKEKLNFRSEAHYSAAAKENRLADRMKWYPTTQTSQEYVLKAG
jgi:hypothetical protein